MSTTTDPPSDERKYAGFWKRMRGFGRKFVNRKTFIAALQIVLLMTRIAKALKQLVGDL